MFVSVLLLLIAAYLVAGFVFACAFHARGLRVVDPNTHAGATALFRLLISPGVIALWPLLALRWRAASRAPSTGVANPAHGAHA